MIYSKQDQCCKHDSGLEFQPQVNLDTMQDVFSGGHCRGKSKHEESFSLSFLELSGCSLGDEGFQLLAGC